MAAVTEFLNNPKSIGTWNLVPGESSINFENTTMWGAMKVRGGFTEFTGSGELKDATTVFGKIEIKAASIETGLGWRNKDLQGKSYFDAERYPNIVVTVTGGKASGGDLVLLEAKLTVKGITGPMPMKVHVAALDDLTVRLKAQTTVTRKQFAVEGDFFGSVGNKTRLVASLVFKHT